MSGLRHDGRERRAGRRRTSLQFVVSVAAVVSVVGCGIGLTGASLAEEALADAGVPVQRFDAGGLSDSGRPRQGITPPPTVDASALPIDAGVVVATMSPLCGAPVTGDSAAACSPDLGSCTPAAGAGAADAASDGQTIALDGGMYSFGDAAGSSPEAGVSLADGGPGAMTTGQSACRVMAVRGDAGGSSVAAMCTPSGTGMGESTCTASSDCAAGFECVVDLQTASTSDAAPTGACRAYCCGNHCPDAMSCQHETTIGGSVVVPVCIPSVTSDAGDGGAPCQLLDDMTCPSGTTCQIVTELSGLVQCVTPGTATAGQSCETTSCAAGFSCIAGVFPYRTCAQLCDQEGDDCPVGQTCTSNPALSASNAQIGVCGM